MQAPKRDYRVVTFLKREELEFLDGLIKDLYFDYGIKIPRAKLIEEIVEAFKETQPKQEIEREVIERFKDKKRLKDGNP